MLLYVVAIKRGELVDMIPALSCVGSKNENKCLDFIGTKMKTSVLNS